MPVITYLPCTNERCGRHHAGYRNYFGLCYSCSTFYFLATNGNIQEKLRLYSLRRRPGVASLIYPLLRDLHHQLNNGRLLHPEVLLRELGIDYKADGGYPWEAFGKASEVLQKLQIIQIMRVVRSPCSTVGCNRVGRNLEDLFYLDIPNSINLDTSLQLRFNTAEPTQRQCNYCKRLTDRRMEIAIVRMPDYLVIKLSQNSIFTFPLELTVPQNFIHPTIVAESRIYGYFGHCKVIGGVNTEHSICVIRDRGYMHSLHKYNNDIHSVGEIPEQEITDHRVDMIIYERLINGVRQSELIV